MSYFACPLRTLPPKPIFLTPTANWNARGRGGGGNSRTTGAKADISDGGRQWLDEREVAEGEGDRAAVLAGKAAEWTGGWCGQIR